MTTSATKPRHIGSSIKRREDPKLITGRGTFTDDIKLPGLTHAAIVRSPFAHAAIRGIDSTRAESTPGVLAVFVGKDFADAGVNGIPVGWLHADIKLSDRRIVAIDRVRYVGEAVAVVVADSPYTARDAAELVEVDYDELPAVANAEKALEPGAPNVQDSAPDNVCFRWSLLGDKAAVDAAIAAAPHVVRQRLINHRIAAVAIEPRSAIGSYNSVNDELTLYVTSQNPHVHRLIMGAFVLGVPEHKFRVIAPDVGGGFGSKIHVYPEENIVCWASKRLGVPVKWTAERRESFMTDSHGRDHVSEAEAAFDDDGKMLALRVRTIANMGAHLSLFAPCIPTALYVPLLAGQYAVPSIHAEITGVYTHTTPVDAVRGAGRPEACYLVERVMDLAAGQLGLDPAEIRRRNFIPADKFPYQTPVAVVYDSGNYGPALERALEMSNYTHLRGEQARLRAEGRLVGIGIASYIEACGIAPSAVVGSLGAQAGLWESATVRVYPTGKVSVFTGTHAHGQGHETTFSQLVADELGIPMDDIDIVHGDTGRIAHGMGSYGSRSIAVGGSAIHMSIQRLLEKGRRIAAHLLEASPDDMDFEDGKFFVRGSPDRAKSVGDVALAAYLAHNLPADMEPGFEFTSFYDPKNFVFPFGSHVALVEIDRETGTVKLLRYVAVDDVGTVINPTIVNGQIHGGVVHGIGQALHEAVIYDDNGQLLTASLNEYGLPRADQLPPIEVDGTVTPAPDNPLGVKGAGEAGAIASTAAVANAVTDALAPLGIKHIDMPLSPPRIWSAIQAADGR